MAGEEVDKKVEGAVGREREAGKQRCQERGSRRCRLRRRGAARAQTSGVRSGRLWTQSEQPARLRACSKHREGHGPVYVFMVKRLHLFHHRGVCRQGGSGLNKPHAHSPRLPQLLLRCLEGVSL